MSIRFKAAVIIILIVFAVTAANFFSSLSFTTQSVMTTMKEEQSLDRDLANNLVRMKLEILETNAASAAKRYLRARWEGERTEAMTTALEEFPDFTAFAVFDQEGLKASYGAAPASDSFLKDRHYLSDAFNGKSVMSTTYSGGRDGELVFYLCVPLGDGMVLAATVPGMIFYDLLSEYRLWETGSIYILDGEGAFIAYRDAALVQARANYIEQAQTDPDLRSAGEFFQRMTSSEEGIGTYVLHGEERVCSYKRVPSPMVDWVLRKSWSSGGICVIGPFMYSPRANLPSHSGLSLKGNLYPAGTGTFWLPMSLSHSYLRT
jgi:hypothetical protein